MSTSRRYELAKEIFNLTKSEEGKQWLIETIAKIFEPLGIGVPTEFANGEVDEIYIKAAAEVYTEEELANQLHLLRTNPLCLSYARKGHELMRKGQAGVDEIVNRFAAEAMAQLNADASKITAAIDAGGVNLDELLTGLLNADSPVKALSDIAGQLPEPEKV